MFTSVLFAALFSSQAALVQTQPQEQPDRGPREERRRRFDRGGPGGPRGFDDPEERQRRREQWQRYRNATPEERRQLRNERMLDMTARTYELSDEQREQVRVEMQAMQEERRAKMGPAADEYDKLRDEMFEYWRTARESSGEDGGDGERRRGRMREFQQDPEFQALRSRMREIEEQYPFDMEAAAQRIEALLPPEQAAKGRERREQWMRRREERRDDRREDREANREMRQITRALREGQPPPAGVDLERLLSEANRQLQDPSLTEEQRNAIRKALEAASRQAGAEKPAADAPAPVAKPPRDLHPWEQYVSDFAARHELTEAQLASARAILKEALTRSGRLEQANATRRAEAEKIADPKVREQKLKELDEQVVRVFNEMKTRLDNLLTSAQRRKASAPAEKPART